MQPDEQSIVPPYDFTSALALTVVERLQQSVEDVKQFHKVIGYADWEEESDSVPPAIPPSGGTPQEIVDLQKMLGIELPEEYVEFLLRWRYLEIKDGRTIWGLAYNGISRQGSPWVSEEHPTDGPCLVFADCWEYADGDQLLIPIQQKKADGPVLLYLHEHGPRIEAYAPSFS